MNEITIEDQIYVSSKRAAEITGYAKDYVGQLCREGRIEARLIGRNWYVRESALRDHRFGEEKKDSPIKIVSSIKEPDIVIESNYIKVSEPEILPYLDKKNETKVHSPLPVEEMQQAWKDWFTEQRENESPAPVQVKKIEPKIVQEEPEPILEAQIQPTETPVEEVSTFDVVIKRNQPAPKISHREEYNERITIKKVKKGNGVFNLIAGTVAVAAIVITVLNLGFVSIPKGYINSNTANAIQGIKVYRK